MKEILIPENTFNSKGEKLIIQTKDKDSFLKAKRLKDTLKEQLSKPRKRKLFGQLWWENELLILFATTGVGKTILGVQLAEAIASGKNVFEGLTEFINECGAMIVLLLDYELSPAQLIKRYTDKNGKNLHDFHDNLIRLDSNDDFEFKKGDSMEDLINKDIERYIIKYKPKVLIIDNLSVLKSGTENSKEALPLMQMLNNLKKKYNLSILVIGHTPKKDTFSAINMNHLQGSAQIGNALDGCIALAMCHNKEDRYLIELKQRNESFIAHSDSVIRLDLNKEFNFLKFTYLGQEPENTLLSPLNADAILDLEKYVIEESKKGHSHREIAITTCWGKSKIGEVIKCFTDSGHKDLATYTGSLDKTGNKKKVLPTVTESPTEDTESQVSMNLNNSK